MRTKAFTLIEVLIVIAILAILAAMLKGAIDKAKQRQAQTTAKPQPVQNYQPPEFDVSKHTNTVPDVDPATIGQVNTGFEIDLDGDGTADFVKLEGDTLWWTRNRQGTAVGVLKIKGDIIAYSVQVRAGDSRPSLLFWTRDRKGYYQKCEGLTQGVPYFGQVESQ